MLGSQEWMAPSISHRCRLKLASRLIIILIMYAGLLLCTSHRFSSVYYLLTSFGCFYVLGLPPCFVSAKVRNHEMSVSSYGLTGPSFAVYFRFAKVLHQECCLSGFCRFLSIIAGYLTYIKHIESQGQTMFAHGATPYAAKQVCGLFTSVKLWRLPKLVKGIKYNQVII